MTSVSEIWLDKNSQEVSEADAILHLRKGDVIWLRWRDAVTDPWRAASAETFGMALGVGYGRTVIKPEAFTKLLDPALEAECATELGERIVKDNKAVALEEYGLTIDSDASKAYLLLYINCFPVAWRWMLSFGMTPLYDGFYGRLHLDGASYYSAKDYRAFVAEIFGKATKPIMRLAVDLNIFELETIYAYKGLIPAERLAELTATAERNKSPQSSFAYGRYTPLAELSQPIVERLFVDQMSNHFDYEVVDDALDMLRQVPQERFKLFKGVADWSELHNRAFQLVELKQDEIDETFTSNYATGLARFASDEELELKPLLSKQDFIKFGDALSVCLGRGSHFQKLVKGGFYYFVVYKLGKMVGALEVTRLRSAAGVTEYRGPHNTAPPNEEKMKQRIDQAMALMEGGASV